MKKLRYIAWFVLLIALAASVLTTYILIQQQGSLKENLKDVISSQVHSEISNIPTPTNGTDGKNATPEQISHAVSTYLAQNPIKNGSNGTNGSNATDEQVQQAVNNYLIANPIKNTDGKDGIDGKTPQIQCNLLKNRWEVKYSETDNWQVLNGQIVKCAIN